MGCFAFKNVGAVAVVCGAVALAGTSAFAITPNKLVSGGLPAHTGATTTDYLTDGYLTNWKSSNAKEIALNVGEGPKKLLINWESYGDCAWATDFTSNCGHTGVALSNFKILTSANSTDGTDGDWTEAASIVFIARAALSRLKIVLPPHSPKKIQRAITCTISRVVPTQEEP